VDKREILPLSQCARSRISSFDAVEEADELPMRVPLHATAEHAAIQPRLGVVERLDMAHMRDLQSRLLDQVSRKIGKSPVVAGVSKV
jgi:hypothetical protein